MAKDKKFELEYKNEGRNRCDNRKQKRKEKYHKKCETKRNRVGCQVCGEYPYCYCGDGTPYSY